MIEIRKPTKIKQIIKLIGSKPETLKAVCDLENRILILNPDLHIDAEDYLNEIGSKSKHIWGFYVILEEHEIEFDAMINFKPMYNNFSEVIADEILKDKIRMLVTDLLDL